MDQRSIPDDALINALRAAHRLRPRLTKRGYDEVRESGPLAETIVRRFRTWNRALAAAGIAPVRTHTRPRAACHDCALPPYARGYCREHYLVFMREHGHEQTSGRGKYTFVVADGVSVLEHRAVMEALLGRALLSGETVHHRGAPRDNRPSSLEIRVSCEHPAGWTVPEALAWADEIVARYR